MSEVEREAIRIVEREGSLAVEHRSFFEVFAFLVENCEPTLEGATKARFFELERLSDQRFSAQQLGISLSHFARKNRHEFPHQRLFRTKQFRVPHRAPHDAAEHVTTALVGRQYAVGNQERRCAQMVSNDPMRGLLWAFRIDSRQFGDRADEGRKEIDRIIVVGSLQNGGNALEPHAGVYRRTRQIYSFPTQKLLVLHEDEIPDLNKAISLGVGRARGAAGNVRSVIVEDFRTGTAGSGLTHGPEVVVSGNAQDLAVGKSRNLFPKLKGVIIVDVYCDEQLVLGQRVLFRDQVPGELDRALLEVITEGKVAEHLKERVMPCGVPDIVEIIMLAAGAHTFLGGDGSRIGPLLQAGEDILELHHPCVGEHQGRVIARHKRRRRHHLVTVARKEIEETFADIVDAAHFRTVRASFACA